MIDKSRINFDQEIKDQFKVKLISGSDEAGRGAMAGPIVVASVILPCDYENSQIKDSKKLSLKMRETLFEEIKSIALAYQISIVNSSVVDLINPKQSSIKGMRETISKLEIKPDLCLIDAEKVFIENYQCISFIKGDYKSQSIAAASILAKVTRDHIMVDYDEIYPNYNFRTHKGYCTLKHQQALFENGVSPIHRILYKPVKFILERLK